MRIIVTGGMGFIGLALVGLLLRENQHELLIIDVLSYAANPANLEGADGNPNYHFLHADINDAQAIAAAVRDFRPEAVFNLAAHTHVDRSINNPAAFIHNNINGSYQLLEVIRGYWQALGEAEQRSFRFIQVSTDEVYGDRQGMAPAHEGSPYNPSSPYAASKACADHLVLAWRRTYGLPALITHCTNNYGPYQYPEKLIPLAIDNAVRGKSIPIYGDGQQVRDWLFVDDHARALRQALKHGQPGQHYHMAGGAQVSNLTLIRTVCRLLDEYRAGEGVRRNHAELIEHVVDRPGHDRLYALTDSASRAQLQWQPQESLADGLRKTVAWYLAKNASV